jgi:ketosteroid isomerase-like protein
MILQLFLAAFCVFVSGNLSFAAPDEVASTVQRDRAADAAEIRAHIESIFQAFLDGDIEKIHATHSDDWRGLLDGSRTPIKGIDEYMRANGIEWPRPANAPKRTPYYPAGTRYVVNDFDVHFYSPELAVANFLGGFERDINGAPVTLRRFRIMDVYAKRKGSWIQVASHTVVDPEWRQEQMAMLSPISPELREQILTAREAVWRAFFTNDQKTLAKLVPADTIVLESAREKPFTRQAEILQGAKDLAQSGSKLKRLEFPQTEMQVYGSTAIIYTTYLYELENKQGERHTSTGRATEIFVYRDGAWVNPGWHMAASGPSK